MKIKFSAPPFLIEAAANPVPALAAMPEWYKKSGTGHDDFYPVPHKSNGTVKKCVPFLDALTTGYTILAAADIFIKGFPDGGSGYTASSALDECLPNGLIGTHGAAQMGKFKYMDGNHIVLKYQNPFMIETPKGFSCLFTPVLNSFELQSKGLHFLSGIVDSDVYNVPIAFPFLFTNFEKEVIIEKGTPLVQVIPFKKEDWKMSMEPEDEAKIRGQYAKVTSRFKDSYKRAFWRKSKYR